MGKRSVRAKGRIRQDRHRKEKISFSILAKAFLDICWRLVNGNGVFKHTACKENAKHTVCLRIRDPFMPREIVYDEQCVLIACWQKQKDVFA